MVTALKVTNYLGETLSIDPFDPESSGFLITDIKGITPNKADINFTSITTNDGGLYNSARIGTRNITMKLVYFPHPTIEQTRLLSYKYFPVKRPITLEFKTENRQAQIQGYVESNDINIFTKTEYSSISVVCPDPYFYSTGPDGEIDVVFAGTAPKMRFSFPSKSEGGTIVDGRGNTTKALLMGDIQTFREQVLTYNGDSEIGAEIIFRALGAVGNVTIYNRITNESMMVNADKIAELTGSGIIAGDVITIYTYRGNKQVLLLRNGITTNIINCLDKNTVWLQIRKGDNVFAFSATSGAIDLQVEIKTKTIYEGL